MKYSLFVLLPISDIAVFLRESPNILIREK